MKNKRLFIPLNIQLFADEGGSPTDNGGADKGGQAQDPKTTKEYLDLKKQFDNTSSEIANLKKQLKEKMTEEEKRSAEKEAEKEEFEKLKKELSSYKIKSSLSKDFDEKEITEITNAILSDDKDKLVETICKIRSDFKVRVYDEAKKEFSKSATIPGGNGGEEETIGKKLAEEKKKQHQKPEVSGKWGQFE